MPTTQRKWDVKPERSRVVDEVRVILFAKGVTLKLLKVLVYVTRDLDNQI